MKKLIFLVIIFSYLNGGCDLPKKEQKMIAAEGDELDKVSDFRKDFRLTEKEIIELKKNALDGSVDAAFRLAQYHFHITEDMDSYVEWLDLAAQKGNIVAQHNMAVYYLHLVEKPDLKKAKYWAETARSNGNKESNFLLKEIAILLQNEKQSWQK